MFHFSLIQMINCFILFFSSFVLTRKDTIKYLKILLKKLHFIISIQNSKTNTVSTNQKPPLQPWMQQVMFITMTLPEKT